MLIICATAMAQESQIAVYVVSNELSAAEKKVLGNRISTVFVQSGQYKEAVRNDVFLNAIAKETKKQRDGSVDDEQIRELGKQAGVKFVIVADFTYAFKVYNINAKLLDVETAISDKAANIEMDSIDDIGKVASEIFKQISGTTTGKQVFTDTRDGKNYNIMDIGGLTWFVQELNYEKDKYAYDEAMKACPSGWHLPTNSDWNVLEKSFTENVKEIFTKTSTGKWWSATVDSDYYVHKSRGLFKSDRKILHKMVCYWAYGKYYNEGIRLWNYKISTEDDMKYYVRCVKN
jgi:uncharacterized protein (TIGR02145 family)